MKSIFLALLLSFFVLQGCSLNKLTLLERDKYCDTVIEGYYSSARIWNTMCPALLLKSRRLIIASEIKRDTAGIYFVEKQTRIFQKPDTLYYTYPEIQTVVDSVRNCTFGEIPERFCFKGIDMNIHLYYEDDPKFTPIFLELEPNKAFAYCLRPGTYKIDKIEFRIKENIDVSTILPTMKFKVEANRTNYLGNICLLNNEHTSEEFVKIPFRNIYNAGEAAAVGFMFGMVGSAIYQGMKSENTGADGYYLMKIANDSTFKSVSSRQAVINLIKKI